MSSDEGNSKSSIKSLSKIDTVADHVQASTSSADSNAQVMINQQILDQLQNIDCRLDKLEQKPVKKSSDSKKIKNKAKKSLVMKEHTPMLSMLVADYQILTWLINQS